MKKTATFFAAFAILSGFMMPVAAGAAETSAAVYAAKPGKEYKTVVYDVPLHCANCVKKVKENLSYEKGVKALEVSLEDRMVKVTYDPSKTDEQKLAAAISKLGYKATLKKK